VEGRQRVNLNLVTLGGNLTRAPEVRYLHDGTAVAKCGLAINRKFKDKDEQLREEVCFVDFSIFGPRAEAFAKFHAKGDPALIVGSLRLDSWDDKETGEKRHKLYVVAREWQFCGAGASRAKSDADAAAATVGATEVDKTPF
jgi:single-strand DNA-binding protein